MFSSQLKVEAVSVRLPYNFGGQRYFSSDPNFPLLPGVWLLLLKCIRRLILVSDLKKQDFWVKSVKSGGDGEREIHILSWQR